MIKKKKICLNCGNECYMWSKNMCKICFHKLNPTKSIPKISEKGKIKKQEKKEYTEKQFELFKEIYEEHPTKRCFECDTWVDGKSSAQFHHCLFKSIEKYKKYALEKWNILLLCETCHTQVHTDSSKTVKVNKYTEELKEKLSK